MTNEIDDSMTALKTNKTKSQTPSHSNRERKRAALEIYNEKMKQKRLFEDNERFSSRFFSYLKKTTTEHSGALF